jgi:hypothetical protein
MGTVYFPCGCSISSSMFGNRPLFAIYACHTHAETVLVQSAFEELAKFLKLAVDEVPALKG